MAHIGKPAAAPNFGHTSSPVSRISEWQRTLCDDAEESERQDDLRAVRLRKLPFVLLRMLPRLAGTRFLTLLTELEHVRSHQAGIAEAERQ
jgi:hypothetical protein